MASSGEGCELQPAAHSAFTYSSDVPISPSCEGVLPTTVWVHVLLSKNVESM